VTHRRFVVAGGAGFIGLVAAPAAEAFVMLRHAG
jgi:hypothetical protein